MYFEYYLLITRVVRYLLKVEREVVSEKESEGF